MMIWTNNLADGRHKRRYRIYRYREFHLQLKIRGRWKSGPAFETLKMAKDYAEDIERSHAVTDLLIDQQPRLDRSVFEASQPWLNLLGRGKFPSGMGT